MGWLWWPQVVIVIAAEAVGAAGLLVAVAVAVGTGAGACFMVVFTAINLLGVRSFGEFEFWFAILKVIAILANAIGVARVAGWLPAVASPGWNNLPGPDGFAPRGWAGIGAALLVVVVFAFGGTEIVAVAAAETRDPARSLARAIRTVAWRILVFYLGSIAVIVAVVPWDSPALASPFAAVLEVARIPGAATAITLVAVIALLSALNANLDGASRMIWSLARRGDAPAALGRSDRRNVPVAAAFALTTLSASRLRILISSFCACRSSAPSPAADARMASV